MKFISESIKKSAKSSLCNTFLPSFYKTVFWCNNSVLNPTSITLSKDIWMQVDEPGRVQPEFGCEIPSHWHDHPQSVIKEETEIHQDTSSSFVLGQ